MTFMNTIVLNDANRIKYYDLQNIYMEYFFIFEKFLFYLNKLSVHSIVLYICEISIIYSTVEMKRFHVRRKSSFVTPVNIIKYLRYQIAIPVYFETCLSMSYAKM